jgi:hypothetical protein
MRLLALVGLLGVLSGCGVGVEEEAAAPASERTQMGPPESWCRSYKTQTYCPKYICAWYSYPAPGYCSLPAESVTGEPEQAAPVVEQAPETEQMGPPESWCRSYKSQRYCPSVCAWYSSPAPGYCGLKATE